MQFETLFRPARDNPVSVALIGAGEFGISLIAQSRRMQGLAVKAVADRDLDRVAATLGGMGIAHSRCDSAEAARATLSAGDMALCGSVDDLLALPLDMVVEATGDAEAGARHALAAIEAGRGVTMVTKEAECVVGPVLAAKARAAGVPYTLVEGDQPALLIGLVSWARTLGLPVVCAGKSSEYDYVYDPVSHEVTWTSERVTAPALAGLWRLGTDRTGTIKARAGALAALPQRTVPDYCEMALVANATGLVPDRPDFHAPLTRSAELPELYVPKAHGGLLEGEGRIDVFNCLRRPDEASFAGGVFVVVAWADARSGALFRGKGIPTTADGKYGLVYNPSHLLGVEAPISILAAARLGQSILDERYCPVVDLTARAMRDLPAGHKLDIAGMRHAVPDLEPVLTPAAAVAGASPLPYYMAVGRTLTRPVPSGALITADAVESPSGSTLWRLRAEQDAMFALSSGPRRRVGQPLTGLADRR
ncbi:MAG: flagellar biosynthesis protein FlgA [Hyphomicrobiaceae bacterium]|nr:flagellar biosynthesis protein FlgA [Hyphomicrobiaceae bacterium]